MALASDSLDVAASLASTRSIGKRDSLIAAGLAFIFVVKDIHVLRRALSSIGATTDDIH